ncbi:MAG: DUF2339 domain-containing protein [Caulobacteraceae bacterium]
MTQFAPLAPPPRPSRPPPASTPSRATIERWLAEKGLAWIGGSALVIGGAFLVGYAAQRGFFTPQMRIIAAAALGLALLGVGELIRRRKLAGFGENRLAAGIVNRRRRGGATARPGRRSTSTASSTAASAPACWRSSPGACWAWPSSTARRWRCWPLAAPSPCR